MPYRLVNNSAGADSRTVALTIPLAPTASSDQPAIGPKRRTASPAPSSRRAATTRTKSSPPTHTVTPTRCRQRLTTAESWFAAAEE